MPLTALTALIAPVFGLLGVVVGGALTYVLQRAQQERLHRQARADARQDRVRDAYVGVLRATKAVENLATQDSSALGRSETFAARVERYEREQATLTEAFTTSNLVLILESSDATVLTVSADLWQSLLTYHQAVALHSHQPNRITDADLQEQRAEIDKSRAALIEAMRADLGTTRPTAPRPRRPWRLRR